MATFEIDDEVLKEFESSLEEDVDKWSKGVESHVKEYEKGNVEKAHDSGVMVGYFLPTETALQVSNQQLPDEAEVEADSHLTLLYLGKTDELFPGQFETLKRIVAECARSHAPLQGTIGGIARFPAGKTTEDRDVLVRLVDIPRLEGFREKLFASLEAAGLPPRRDHGYTPHVTIGYVPSDFEGSLTHPDEIPLAVTELTVAIAGEHFTFPLNGSRVVKGLFQEFVKGTGPSLASVHVNRPLGSDEDEDDNTIELQGKITKLARDKQQVFGWATIVEMGGREVTDTQLDVLSVEEMERMAYEYTLECRVAGEMHERTNNIGRLIESCAFTKEKQKAMGIDLGFIGWWVGFQVDDKDTWQKVKDGKLKAFSIHGKGIRSKIA